MIESIESRIVATTYFTPAQGGTGAMLDHDHTWQGTGQVHHESLGGVMLCAIVLDDGCVFVGRCNIGNQHFGMEEVKALAYEDACYIATLTEGLPV